MSHAAPTRGSDLGHDRWPRFDLYCHNQQRPGEPTVCVVRPRDAPPEALATHWIAAKEGSFVDIEDCR